MGPLVVLGFAGTYLAVPIEGETDFIELFAEAFDIRFGGNGGVLSGLDGVLFGRKSKRIVAHRVKYVIAGKAFISGYNIGGYISKGMAHVQTGSRGIGEHIQYVIFGFLGIFSNGIKRIFGPVKLPFGFDVLELILVRIRHFEGKNTKRRSFYRPLWVHGRK